MRKLNRMIAAGALAVPMALGASGIAVAAEDGSGVQNQVGALGGNSSDECNSRDQGNSGDEGLGDILREIFGVGDDECSNGGGSQDNGGILGGGSGNGGGSQDNGGILGGGSGNGGGSQDNGGILGLN